MESAIGTVPENWTVRPLSEVGEVQTGVAKGKATSGPAIEVPYLRVANVQDGRLDLTEMKTIAVEPAALDRYRLRPGDVLFTEGGDFDKLGRGCVWGGEIDPCLHQNHVFAVRTHSDLLPDFLAAHAASQRGRAYFLDCAKRTTNLASINSTQLKAFPVPVPPLSEQRGVVATLKAVNDAIAAGEAVAGQLDRVRRELVEKLVGESCEPSAPIAEVGTVSYGLTVDGARRKAPRVAPYLTVANVGAEGDFDLTVLKEVGTFENDARYMLEEGDVLVIEGNANPKRIGVAAIWRGTLAGVLHQNHLMRIRPDRAKVDPEWLCYALATPGCREQIEGRAKTTSGLHTINSTALGSVRIPLPTLLAQQHAVATLSALEHRLRMEREVAAQRRRLKSALADALLTGRIRVPAPDGV